LFNAELDNYATLGPSKKNDTSYLVKLSAVFGEKTFEKGWGKGRFY